MPGTFTNIEEVYTMYENHFKRRVLMKPASPVS